VNYTNVNGPVLAIFGMLPKPALITARANLFEARVPFAHVVRLQNAALFERSAFVVECIIIQNSKRS
jgi:hypothetical protein